MSDSWITHPTILRGESVDLLPLENGHLEELCIAASDKRLWEFTPSDGSQRERFFELYTTALSEREQGTQYPFVICDKWAMKLIGSTRLFDIVPKDRKLEIGWTWIAREYWGTSVNSECKLMLLTYCFEVLQAIRVQLKTDETNIRSRKAIEKIGAKFEGVLRKDRMKDNGKPRNTVYYSIIDDEWESVKQNLQLKLGEKSRNR